MLSIKEKKIKRSSSCRFVWTNYFLEIVAILALKGCVTFLSPKETGGEKEKRKRKSASYEEVIPTKFK